MRVKIVRLAARAPAIAAGNSGFESPTIVCTTHILKDFL